MGLTCMSIGGSCSRFSCSVGWTWPLDGLVCLAAMGPVIGLINEATSRLNFKQSSGPSLLSDSRPGRVSSPKIDVWTTSCACSSPSFVLLPSCIVQPSQPEPAQRACCIIQLSHILTTNMLGLRASFCPLWLCEWLAKWPSPPPSCPSSSLSWSLLNSYLMREVEFGKWLCHPPPCGRGAFPLSKGETYLS
jgi:hypothetical protein